MNSVMKNDLIGLADYVSGKCSFIPDLLPAAAIAMPVSSTLDILTQKLGAETLEKVLQSGYTQVSPLEQMTDASWMRTTNMVGVNVRTIGHFWNLINYQFTLPACQQSIHLLPIWEPGVVSSLYGMASWHINREFFCEALALARPELDTVEKQLKATINVLHALGRVVGLDVIPHADRYAEIVLTNPRYFEWLERKGAVITDHSENLFERIQDSIFEHLLRVGPALEGADLPADPTTLFSLPPEERCLLLFGEKNRPFERNERRSGYIQHLHKQGLEPAPATMGPPYRGLEVDLDEEAAKNVADDAWLDYRIVNPGPMSRVFGPLTRYKLYANKNNNADWEIDFDRPLTEVWDYVCHHYTAIQREYHFDFMRGDMSHVQMRPGGVPETADNYYDIHRAVLRRIRMEKPYFAYFAETFLAPPGTMAFGSEEDHLDLSEADATLGDLQSMVMGEPQFLQNFRLYLDLLHTRGFAPCFTIMTGDKDDPRFDKFYLSGNESRFFMSLFLTDMPSYMGLGFECRDPHPEPAKNEYYTKLYVFQLEGGPKATQGPYLFGGNTALFHRLNRIRLEAERLLPEVPGPLSWLIPPDATGDRKVMAWMPQEKNNYLFVVNADTNTAAHNVKIPCPLQAETQFRLVFSALENEGSYSSPLRFHNGLLQIDELAAGDAVIIQIDDNLVG